MNTEADDAGKTPRESRLFVYEPRAPRVPAVKHCQYQRWYEGKDGAPYVADAADVFRDATRDQAELRINNGFSGVRVMAAVALTVPQLRDLAERLLNAADDIEADLVAAAAA